MIETTPGRRSVLRAPAVCAEVAAFGAAEAEAADLPALRQQLVAAWAGTLSAPLLRQADEQCIVALAALRQACDRLTCDGEAGADWPVLAAPRHFGRAAMAASLERTRVDGPWGVSPHFVAHRSMHSLPGLLSLALRTHGLNLGIGGGPDAESEVLLAAAVFLLTERVRGLWVVLSEWGPEAVPTPQGEVPPKALCRAAVLALTPAGSEAAACRVCIVCRPELDRQNSEGLPGFTLQGLVAALQSAAEYSTTWVWYLEHGLLELHWPGTSGEAQR